MSEPWFDALWCPQLQQNYYHDLPDYMHIGKDKHNQFFLSTQQSIVTSPSIIPNGIE